MYAKYSWHHNLLVSIINDTDYLNGIIDELQGSNLRTVQVWPCPCNSATEMYQCDQLR